MPRSGAQKTTGGSRRLTVVGGRAPRDNPHAPLAAGPHNLPENLAPFVGRGREIADVGALLACERLVTLTGPSGVGKTRLAIAVANETQAKYPSGVWLVKLAPVAEPNVVAETVAVALGLDPEPGRPATEAVASHVGTEAALLVLDNCEHLLDACADLVNALLERCRWLRILTTSQQPLGVENERTIAVAPFAVADSQPASPEEALACEAIALFAIRATATGAGFVLTDETLPSVVEICRRLDGIPLAIELAAARVASLGTADIAERLERRFRLLTGGASAADPRHQTLRAALDWSYELLDQEEATLLRRLSVFAGGAGLHAVEDVCGGKGVPRDDVVDLLASLVAKSLVVADTGRARARYRMLETVRAYAQDRLEEDGELAAILARHAAWSVALVERAWHQVTADDQRFWTEALEIEHENLRTALDWTVANRPELGLRLAGALTPFWKTRGYFHEGQLWLQKTIDASPGAGTGLLARALYGLALFAVMRGDVATARRAADQSLAVAREGGLKRAEAQALNLAGFVAIFSQDAVAAKPVLEESVALARADGDPAALINSLALFGRVHIFLGAIGDAHAVFEECLALADQAGEETTGAAIGLGWTSLIEGDLDGAHSLFAAALADLRRAGERFEIALVLSFLGELAWQQGRLADAAALIEEGSSLAVAMGAPFPLFRCLATQARVALARDDLAEAERLAAGACRVARTARLPYALVRALQVQGEERQTNGDLIAAEGAYQEALTVARSSGDRVGEALSLAGRSAVAFSRGAEADAATFLIDALTIQAETGDASFVTSLEAMATLAIDQGRGAAAAGLFGSAEAIRTQLGLAVAPGGRHEADVERLRASMSPDDLAVAWSQGASLSRPDALALATRGRGGKERLGFGWGSLSPTEGQVVDFVAQGLTNKEIADRMFMSSRTVQGYLSRIFTKLGVDSRRQLRDLRRPD